MLLEKEYFDIWMRRIMERLEAIEQRQKPPKAQEYPTLENGEKLFDNYDLCRMLHVSKRTLQRYRSKCGLKYRMLNQKAFYKESDVQQFIRDNFVLFARRREDQRPYRLETPRRISELIRKQNPRGAARLPTAPFLCDAISGARDMSSEFAACAATAAAVRAPFSGRRRTVHAAHWPRTPCPAASR